jgi:hypothetical protein
MVLENRKEREREKMPSKLSYSRISTSTRAESGDDEKNERASAE